MTPSPQLLSSPTSMNPATAVCPVCHSAVTAAELRATLERLASSACFESALQGTYSRWACPTCFATERALRADPSRQSALPSAWPPTCPLYVDRASTCRECGAAFLFDRYQQRTWYEDYGIPFDVDRIRCDKCTALYRAGKRINRLVPRADPQNLDHALALARDYEILGNLAKHRLWRKRADALLAAGARPTAPPLRPRVRGKRPRKTPG